MKELPEHYPAPPIAEAIPPTERVLEFLIQERGEEPELLFSLANVLLRKGRTVEALKFYRSALEKSPHTPRLRTNLGVALILLGEREDAEQQFRQALLQEPDLELALLHLGTVLEERKDYDGALKLLDRFLQARSERQPAPKPALLAGRCADALERHEVAKGYFEMAASGGIEEALAWLLAHDVKEGVAAFDRGDPIECARILHRNYERAAGLFTRDQRVQDTVRELSAKAGKDDRLLAARSELRSVPEADRQGPLYRHLVEIFISLGVAAEVFEESGDLEEQAARWKKALDETKNYPYGNYRHAIITAYQGDLRHALDELDLCRSKLPEKKQRVLKLQQMMDALGDLSTALAE